MALVCARPDVGSEALERGEALPPSAGLMGIITMEDALEELLQEQILDETDKLERNELRLAKWALGQWHLYVSQRKVERELALFQQSQDPKLLDVVNRARSGFNAADVPRSTDSTPLLCVPDGSDDKGTERRASFLRLFK